MKRIKHLYDRGCRHSDSWQETHSAADLDSAIACFSELYGTLPEEAALRPSVEGHLGFCLAFRHVLTGSIQDRDEAICSFMRLTARPDPDGDWDSCRKLLGELLGSRATGGQPPDGSAEAAASGQPGQATNEQILGDLATAVGMLAVAVTSRTLDAGQRAEAERLRVHLTALVTLGRSWETREAGGLPDIEELRAARRDLPADDPSSPQLLLELGLALGFLATRDESPDDKRQAVECLTEALERIGPADPQRGHATVRLALLLLSNATTEPDAVPMDRILRMADEALSAPGLDKEQAAMLHLMAGMAYSNRALREGSRDGDEKALAHLNQAKDLVPEDHLLRPAVVGSVGNLLSARFMAARTIDDHDASGAYTHGMQELIDERGLLREETANPAELRGLGQVAHPGVRRGLAATKRLMDAVFRRDQGSADQALADLGQALAGLPPDNEWRQLVMAMLGDGWLARATLSADRNDVIRGHRLLMEAGEQAAEDTPLHRWLSRRAEVAQAELGRLTRNRGLIDDAIRRLSATGGGSCLLHGEQAKAMWELGMALIGRYSLTDDPRDLNNGIVKLEDARRAADSAQAPADSALLQNLSAAYRDRGDRHRRDPQRAIDTAMLGLRDRAAEVLLQTGAQRSVWTASQAASILTAQLVSWCLADGRRDQAVEALELGRALVLHATTIAADVPGLLRAAGQDGLAARWQQEVSQSKRAPSPWDSPLAASGGDTLLPHLVREQFVVPADIRRQVLAALRGTPADAGWLTPPDIGELTAALGQAGCDAFVYLIPPHGSRPGCALVLRADGVLDEIPLPGLTDGPVAAYDAAHQAWLGGPEDDSALRRWHSALANLCDWAWEAVTGPVLRHVARWPLTRPPRLVLIPAGNLGAVPWHAARTTRADGSPRYAIEDAVFSYAASARQLADAARRPARPWGDAAVLVANPTGDLPMAGLEARELLRRYYPGALLLGRPKRLASGAGTPDEVLASLPGGTAPQASLLHCGCHATVAGSLSASYLLLADKQQLTIAQIVAQAQRRIPGGRDSRAPGFLAVLGACMSDLADVDHDEALTLASALLAAGASGVVGARWPTDDLATALLMVMFHHFLNSGRTRPADALRAAQIWMLDPGRRGLEDLSLVLADATTDSGLGEIQAWAAFTYQGT